MAPPRRPPWTSPAGRCISPPCRPIPGPTLLAAAGALLDLVGFNQTLSSLSGPGDSIQAVNHTLTLAIAAGTTAFPGAVALNTALTKSGTGTLILSGAGNAYTGATQVAAGVLELLGGAPPPSAAQWRRSAEAAGATLELAGGATLLSDQAVGALRHHPVRRRQHDGGEWPDHRDRGGGPAMRPRHPDHRAGHRRHPADAGRRRRQRPDHSSRSPSAARACSRSAPASQTIGNIQPYTGTTEVNAGQLRR